MSDSDRFVPVIVSGLARDPQNNPVVLLQEDGGQYTLPIWIGPAESVAIELHLKGEVFARPLTHDLLKTMLESLGASVSRVAITDLRDNTFFARIYLQRGKDVFVIDARPSDSIALALKTGAPIVVARAVFQAHRRADIASHSAGPPGEDDLKRYLEGLDPGDF